MRWRKLAVRALAASALLWQALVIAAYFGLHKPWDPGQFEAWGRNVISLLGLTGMLSLALAMGQPWVRRIVGPGERWRFPLSIGVGFALLGYVSLALGAVGLYHPTVAWGIVLLSLPWGLPALTRGLRAGLVSLPRSRVDRALALFAAFILTLAFLRALAPPTAWDSLVYHLTGPRLYLKAGSLHHDLDLPHLGFPQAGSMLFAFGLLLGGDRIPQLIHLLFAILTLSLLRSLTERWLPGRGWLAVAILVGVPSATLLAGAAYVEWLVMFGGLAGMILLVDGAASRRPPAAAATQTAGQGGIGTLGLAGLLAALALGSKYTAIWLLVGLGLAVIVWRRKPKDLLIFAGWTVIFTLPYLAKNLILTGNPVYPFFFPGVNWDAHRSFWYSRPGTGLEPFQLLIAPWEATVWGLEGGFYLGHPSYGASLGPFLLGLAPLALIGVIKAQGLRRRWFIGLSAIVLVAYLGWLGQLAYSRLLIQSRLLFPVLPQIALLGTLGFVSLGDLGRWGRSVRFIVGGLLLVSFLLLGMSSLLQYSAGSAMGVVLGSQNERSYLEDRLGFHMQVMSSLAELPAGSQVRFLWEPRSYYCPSHITCEPDALTDRWWHALQHHPEAASVRAWWQSEGVTHVLHYRLGARVIQEAGRDPLSAQDWGELEKFLRDEVMLIASFGEAYSLYRLP